MSEEPVDVRVGDVEETTSTDSWKDLQDKYLAEDGVVGANFIDVDGDSDQEMIILGENGTGNEKLITYHDGAVSILPLNGAALGYVPGENAILVGEYEDHTYIVSVYSIVDGKWTKQCEGSYQDPASGPAEDEEGNDIYENFKWNGSSVSELEFYTALVEAIDVEDLVDMGVEEG